MLVLPRTVPYDQWLTTHVDAGWKVKQVKLWILSKCIGIPLDASTFPFPSSSRTASADAFDGATPSGQRYRPKSPITFAPDPRTLRRPVSPILFAKGTGKKRKGKGKADKEDAEYTPVGSPTGERYEQDSESDVADDDGSLSDELAIYRNSPPPPLPVAPLPRPPTPPLPTHPASSKWARYNLSPSAYTLIRFSTGQALEDDLSLTFFNLSSYELLELHAHGDVCSSHSCTSSSSNMTSHASTSDNTHTRTNSLYSQISNTTAPSPPPSHTRLRSKDRDRDGDIQPIYIAHLPRHDLHQYIQPYWEGPVRELRSVPRRSIVPPMPSFSNGYGYGYSGTEFSERAVALGIGNPPPLPLPLGRGVSAEGVQSRIEWRPKHVVIKDGLFMLCMSREDPNPRHIVPLEAFTALRGADTLIAHLRSWDQHEQYQQSQSQFKARSRTTASLATTITTTTTTTSLPFTAAFASTSHHPYASYSNYISNPNPKPSKPHKPKSSRARAHASHHQSPVSSSHASASASDDDDYDYDDDDDDDSEIEIGIAGADLRRYGRAREHGGRRGRGRRRGRSRDGGGGERGVGDQSFLSPSSNINPHPLAPQLKHKPNFHKESASASASSTSFSSSNDDDDDDDTKHVHVHTNPPTPKTIANEPVEDLHIVVLMYMRVDRMRRVVGVDRDGVRRVEYVRGGEGGGKEPKQPKGGKDVKEPKGKDGKEDKDGKGRKRRGKAFLWERDGRDKDKAKEREGGKRRDWIPGFGVKRDRERERDVKDKDRDKEREREREGKERGMGMGISIGPGLQDVRGQVARESVREREREKVKEKVKENENEEKGKVTPSEAGAEAKIVFARRPEADVSSDDGGDAGVGEEEGAVDEGDEGEGESGRGWGIRDKGVGRDKGKRKAKAKAKAKVKAGEGGGGVDVDVEADVDGDGDGDSDLDAGDAGDSPSLHTRTHTHARYKSSSHAHAHVHSHTKLASSSATPTPSGSGVRIGSVVGGAGDGGDSESEAWSSPVFAHSDNTTDRGSDAESDIGRGGSRAHGHGHGHGGETYRYGYRYGYQGPGYGFGYVAGMGEGAGAGTESLGAEKDRLEKERMNLERRQKERARRREEEVRKEEEKTEWIILDVGSDLAYRSLLRVLHRHLTPAASSDFIPSPPVFSIVTPTSVTPTQTQTPFPSPTSPRAGAASQNFHWFPSSDEDTPMDSTSTFATSSRRDSHPSPTSVSSEASGQEFPQHPAVLASLSRSGKKTTQPFDVLPYPEWRLEVTERAQRAGMGNVGRAMKWVRWGSKAQLELDVEELLRRYSASDDASDKASRESIRKKKKEATSLKNRRKSTTSTLTGGKSSGRSGLKDWDREGEGETSVYDSDVSEDTARKMLEMSDSEEESEAEWHGWMADLHRQRQIRKQQMREEAQKGVVQAAKAVATLELSDGGYREPADGTEIRNRRVMLEPKGVISVRPTDGPGLQEGPGLTFSQSTSATLYSPSSSDSLRRATFSLINRSSSPAGTFHNPQTSRGSSLSPSPLGVRQHILPVGSTLSHSTSMYASIRSDAHAAEQNLRRPSMPILTSEQMFPLLPGPVIPTRSSVIRSPVGSKFVFPSMPHSPPYSPSFSSSFPAEEAPSNAASSSRSPSEPSSASALSRRASSAGLTNPGGSLSRSASVLTRGSLLRRDAGKEAERFREKERRKEEKAKEKEDRAKEKERAKEFEREAKEVRKSHRPKLSLATTSTHQLVPQPTIGVVRTTPKVETDSSLMRRVKSGSNLNEEITIDESTIPDSTKDASNLQKKKKRGVFVNRIVKKLDSAMDFVDGRQ
ncbi:hypothetical protein C0989_010413 [Termitomyces sp. Mn162]|nr:hypothetical protein C0989_010413 [Termitomyces sp. Mn162]